MLRVLFLISLTFTFAWENFRVRGINGVSNTTALSTCFSAGLCTLNAGCCTGHGTCQVDASGNATCVCDKPQECRQGATINSYSGRLCDTYASPDCCTSGGSDLIFSSNGGCHLLNADATPEKGAKGNLLKRDGAALFSDANGITDPQLNLTQIDQIIAVLNATSRGTTKTKGNMMGLGFLEFALKDVVDFAYNYSNTVTLYGVTYPKVQWQQNTGIKVGNVSIPKQFENTATSVIDVGPLYDYATRIGSTPYLNITGALVHWQNVLHMPFEFITALKFYNAYHYYAARNYEEFFCGKNSDNNPSFAASACLPIWNSFTSDQALADWFFQQARRSTIRFSQAILEHSVLQILLSYNGTSYGTGMYGFYDAWFEGWFRRDVTVATGQGPAPPGTGPSVPMGPSVRLHQEWAGDVTRTNLTQHLISGLDFLISLRNPIFNYSASSWLNNTNIEGFGGTIPSALAFDVVALTHTKLQRYGSTVASNYSADLALQLYRVGELGLASYKTHIGYLTNQSTTGVSDLSQDYNVYYGAQIETNRSRQYMNATASVAMASVVPINDVLIVDRVSYWAYDGNYAWTGINYHPDPQFITLPPPDFGNCFNGCDESVETVSSNAAMVVLGYNPAMDGCVTDDCSELENIPYFRSSGVTYAQPDATGLIIPPQSYSPITPDFNSRQVTLWRVAPDFLNALYYKYDGLNTLAVHYSGSSTHYLPNQLVDSIPLSIGWNSANFDGTCYIPSILAPAITRFASDMWDTKVCAWGFPYIVE